MKTKIDKIDLRRPVQFCPGHPIAQLFIAHSWLEGLDCIQTFIRLLAGRLGPTGPVGPKPDPHAVTRGHLFLRNTEQVNGIRPLDLFHGVLLDIHNRQVPDDETRDRALAAFDAAVGAWISSAHPSRRTADPIAATGGTVIYPDFPDCFSSPS